MMGRSTANIHFFKDGPSFKKISPRVSELLSRHTLTFKKGHNSIKNVGGVTLLVLCTSPDNALSLYLRQVCESISKGL